MNRYSRGVLYVLNIPDNPGDLYQLPQAVTTAIRAYLQADFPVRLNAPAQVSLIAYDNGSFIVQSFRPDSAEVEVLVTGTHAQLRDLLSDERVSAEPSTAATPQTVPGEAARSSFHIVVPAHSYRAYSAQ
jgi:hypothetical protein